MFEVGFTEIILILGLALLVLGPEKLPALAEKVGRWTGRARAMARQPRTQLEHEVTMEDLAKSRPMQAAPPPSTPPETNQTATNPSPAPAEATSQATVEPAAANPPAHPGPGLDLDTMVSGIEPPAQPAPETSATKAVQ